MVEAREKVEKEETKKRGRGESLGPARLGGLDWVGPGNYCVVGTCALFVWWVGGHGTRIASRRRQPWMVTG